MKFSIYLNRRVFRNVKFVSASKLFFTRIPCTLIWYLCIKQQNVYGFTNQLTQSPEGSILLEIGEEVVKYHYFDQFRSDFVQ